MVYNCSSHSLVIQDGFWPRLSSPSSCLGPLASTLLSMHFPPQLPFYLTPRVPFPNQLLGPESFPLPHPINTSSAHDLKVSRLFSSSKLPFSFPRHRHGWTAHAHYSHLIALPGLLGSEGLWTVTSPRLKPACHGIIRCSQLSKRTRCQHFSLAFCSVGIWS